MHPCEFPQQNMVIAKDQPEYLPLPAFREGCGPGSRGRVITCWRLTWVERLRLLWSGRLWLQQLTFQQPLQPQLPTVESPFSI